ncbi:MAG: VanW family protein [Eubacteriales bacterium]|nr:VanW family protein [Eubacteriales bacterium]
MEAKTANKNRKKHGMSIGGIVAISLLIVVLVLGGTALFLRLDEQHKEEKRQAIITSDVFREGVAVQGVEVGGMDRAQAQAALADAEQALIADVGFTFVAGDKTYTADKSCFDIAFNTESVLDTAMGLARDGDLETLEAMLEDIKTNGRAYAIDYTVEPNAKLGALIDSIAAEVNVTPTEATFTVKQLPTNPNNGEQDIRDIGLPADGSVTDLRDLRFDFAEGTPGRGVDAEAALTTAKERTAAKQFGTIELAFAEIPPTVTIETLKQHLVLRASSMTSFGKGHYDRAERVFNITKATGRIYGTVLQPGEIFSANTVIGDRTEKGGWQLAPAVIEGGAATEDQAGGGVCQVSTTMYLSVLKSDMKVEYRRAHSQQLSYVDGGLDATINTGTIDFTWSNSSSAPVYVFTWVDTKAKTIHCEIYGEPFPDTFDSIELKSELLETLAPAPTSYITASYLTAPYWWKNNGAITGHVYQSYAIYKLGDNVVEKRPIAKTTYNQHPERIYVWPGYDGSPLLSEFDQTAYYQALKKAANQN